jgi:hypothetical protein
MSDAPRTGCKRCSTLLSDADFQEGRAMRLLGAAYCGSCLEAMTPTCHQCRKALHETDFAQGRALTIQGVRFCDGCMEEALRSASTSPVLRVEKPDLGGRSRRVHVRFVPSHEAGLTLKPLGFRGLLRSNIARLWIDVSEGGLRCIVQGTVEVGDLFHGRLDHPELATRLEFQGMARHARPAERFSGCSLIGLRFEEPSVMLQAFIREILGRAPGMLTLSPPTPKPPPTSRTA